MRVLCAAGANAAQDRMIERHPFVAASLTRGLLDSEDLKALGRLLNRRITVKKGQNIIVQAMSTKLWISSKVVWLSGTRCCIREDGRLSMRCCRETLLDFLRPSLTAQSFRSWLQRP